MYIKIIKIDGEFVVVEIEIGEKRVCPVEIFPEGVEVGNLVKVELIENGTQ